MGHSGIRTPDLSCSVNALFSWWNNPRPTMPLSQLFSGNPLRQSYHLNDSTSTVKWTTTCVSVFAHDIDAFPKRQILTQRQNCPPACLHGGKSSAKLLVCWHSFTTDLPLGPRQLARVTCCPPHPNPPAFILLPANHPCLSACLAGSSVCLSPCLSACLPVHPLACLSVVLSDPLSIHLSDGLSVYLPQGLALLSPNKHFRQSFSE